MQNELNPLDELPEELVLKIIESLPLKDLLHIAQTNQKLSAIARDNRLWQKKFAQHFCYLLKNISRETEQDWFQAFKKAYVQEYAGLDDLRKSWFSALKDKNIAGLKDLTINDLMQYSDKSHYSLLAWVKTQSNSLVDELYDQLICSYYRVDGIIDTSAVDKSGKTILHWAVLFERSPEAISQLVAQKAHVDAACNNWASPLWFAACYNYLDLVNSLLDHGANIKTRGINATTPLHIAAERGHRDTVIALLAKGAKVNAKSINSATPLYLAALNGHLDIVNTLLTQGANLHARRSNGATPLLDAANNGHFDIVNTLLTQGANVDDQCNEGKTPIYVAAQRGHLEIVKLLLAHNANVEGKCKDGSTPISIAIKMKNSDIANAINKRRVLDYKTKTSNRIVNREYYNYSMTFFGMTLGLGCSAERKNLASSAINSVFF